jgi:hypothetical protein
MKGYNKNGGIAPLYIASLCFIPDAWRYCIKQFAKFRILCFRTHSWGHTSTKGSHKINFFNLRVRWIFTFIFRIIMLADFVEQNLSHSKQQLCFSSCHYPVKKPFYKIWSN